MRPFTPFLLAIACLALAGFKYPTRIDVPAPAATPGFTVADARPPEQLESGYESLSVTSCAFGSIRVGSEDMQPQPSVVVRDLLAARLGDRLDGREVALLNLAVHVNGAVDARQGVMDSIPKPDGQQSPGLLAEAMIDLGKVGCAPDDLRGGYVAGEVESTSPLVLVLDVAIDGVEHHARCIRPWPVPGPPSRRSPAEDQQRWGSAVAETAACAADRLAEQVMAGTPVPLPRAAEAKAKRARDAAVARKEARRCANARMSGKPCAPKTPAPADTAPGAGAEAGAGETAPPQDGPAVDDTGGQPGG
jgi:hypothetical protein